MVNAQTFTNYNPTNTSNGIRVNQIYAIAIDAQGNIWVGTGGGGVSKFDGSSWTSYTKQANGLPSDNVNALAIDSKGVIWIGTSIGVSKFDGTSWVNYSAGGYARALIIDKQDNIWVGTDKGGVTKFDGTTWTSYNKTTIGLVSNEVKSLAMDNQNNLWVGTVLGVSKYDGTKLTTYQEKDGLTMNYVGSIFIDKDENKWFGTSGGGVTKFNGTNFSNFGLANETINAINADAQGNMWFGTGSGVSKFNGTTWTKYQPFNGLAGSWVGAIAFDNKGCAWFATDKGVSKLDLNTSISDLELNKIQVFPNPTTDYIYLYSILEQKNINLYDIRGKLVLNTTSHNEIKKIDISSLSSGIYYLQIIENNNQLFHKIVKK